MRITNVLYFPNSCYDETEIQSKVLEKCDDWCNNNCYGPGILSCKYEEPLYLSDEWEPFIGDGTKNVSIQATDDAFEGRYMHYSEYSVCTWFYLNQIYTSLNLYLIVMTDTENDITTLYKHQAPALFVKGNTLYA